ncbi:MAG TPA: hypothetical protein VLE02_01105 [Nitrosarchaeum sp.]|nr:hypothetical protein [Nitrosarchaeum sp.]
MKFDLEIDAAENNIFQIDNIIKNFFINYYNNLGAFIHKMHEGEKVHKMKKMIRDIETGASSLLYILKSHKLLTEYRRLCAQNSHQNSFVKLKEHRSQRVDVEKKKKDVRDKYVAVVGIFFNVKYFSLIKDVECPVCHNKDLNCSMEEEFIYLCKCGAEIDVLDEGPSYKDSSRINMSSRYSYSRRERFSNVIDEYQGTQFFDPDLCNMIVKKLIAYMKLHGEQPETVSIEQLYIFLYEVGYSDYYKHIYLLNNIITKKQCQDLSEYKEELMNLFDKQEEGYAQTSDDSDGRSNSLELYYKLYKLLQKVGFPVKLKNFFILKSFDKQIEYDNKTKKAWEYLKWKWIPSR